MSFQLKIIVGIAMLLSLLMLCACNRPTEQTTQEGDGPDAVPTVISLVTNGATEYQVVRGDAAEKKDIDAAVAIRKAIIAKTGAEIGITTDWVKRGEPLPTDTLEILVGKTNRPETEDAMSRIGEDQYIIKMYENRLVVTGAKPKYTMEAVEVFIAEFLSGDSTDLALPVSYERIADGTIEPEVVVDVNKLSALQLKSLANVVRTFDVGDNNHGNNYIYGKGLVLEGICLVYQQTKYADLLPTMMKASDKILMARNDQKNGEGKTCLSGNVDYCWPNKAEDLFAGSENGGIVGHVAFVVECILETPEIWDVTVPDGDPNGLGVTYYERAMTYIRMCDEVLNEYIIKYFVDANNMIIFPKNWTNDDARRGKNPPWNQQWMMSGGFIHMARVHELLGEKGNADYIAKYRAIIQKLLDNFLSQLVLKKTADDYEVYDWGYWPIFGTQGSWGKDEDANDAHAAYDIQGVYYCYIYGYDNINEEILQRFANTMKYVIYNAKDSGGKWFAGSVNGGVGKGRRNYTWPQWYLIGIIDPECYQIFMNTMGDSAGGTSNLSLGRWTHALYVKAILGGVDEAILQPQA